MCTPQPWKSSPSSPFPTLRASHPGPRTLCPSYTTLTYARAHPPCLHPPSFPQSPLFRWQAACTPATVASSHGETCLPLSPHQAETLPSAQRELLWPAPPSPIVPPRHPPWCLVLALAFFSCSSSSSVSLSTIAHALQFYCDKCVGVAAARKELLIRGRRCNRRTTGCLLPGELRRGRTLAHLFLLPSFETSQVARWHIGISKVQSPKVPMQWLR